MTAKRLMYFSVFISLIGLLGLFMSVSSPTAPALIKEENKTLTILVSSQEIKSGRLYSASIFAWKKVPESDLAEQIDYIQKIDFNNKAYKKKYCDRRSSGRPYYESIGFLNS